MECWPDSEVYDGLQGILGKRLAVGEDNLTWTLLKAMPFETVNCVGQHYWETLAENYSKLSVALEAMHECFEPVVELRTGRDITEDIIFGRRSELQRINFKGFYTVLLEKNEELVTVATLRVHDGKVAEIPLVGTRHQYRRLGMCQVLMNELEKRLKELGVKRLVLPAVSSVVKTWTGSFGFSQMAESEKLEFLTYTFMNFQDTIMCQKLLIDLCSSVSNISKENHGELSQVVIATDSNAEKENGSCTNRVAHHQGQTREGLSVVDQGPASVTGSNDFDRLAPPVIMQTPSTDRLYSSSTEKEEELTVLKGDEGTMMVDGDGSSKANKEMKKYSRRKYIRTTPIPPSNCPNVKVTWKGETVFEACHRW